MASEVRKLSGAGYARLWSRAMAQPIRYRGTVLTLRAPGSHPRFNFRFWENDSRADRNNPNSARQVEINRLRFKIPESK
jgi:hypothetical protein